MKLNLRRRDLILIGGFWLIGCALLGTVFYFGVWQSQPESTEGLPLRPQATFTVVYNEVTAKNWQDEAYEYATSRWRDDAELMAITSTWTQTELHAVGQPTAWTYRFYSPGAKRMFFVTITPDGEVIGTLHTERPYKTPAFIAPNTWQIDSPQAISAWLNFGGSTMLAAMPGIQVVAQLQVKQSESPPIWIVAGYDQVTQNYLSVLIDANNSEILNVETSLQ